MNKITIKKSLTFLLILSILSVFNLSVFAETVEEVNAKAAVEIAQQTEFQSDYDYAENLVDNLPNVTTNSFDNSSLIEIPDTNTPSIVVDSTWEVVNENNCGQYLNDDLIHNFHLQYKI